LAKGASALSRLFSDSALKVVFTTLYVDIKEPAALDLFQPTKKNSIVLRRSLFGATALAVCRSFTPGQN
jgi:hypothetical protein